MPKEKWFKLINEEFSEIDDEWQWTYSLLTPITFNEKLIPEPKKKPTWPDVFVPKGIEYESKKYLLVLWFERNNCDWLWIRDCYPD